MERWLDEAEGQLDEGEQEGRGRIREKAQQVAFS